MADGAIIHRVSDPASAAAAHLAHALVQAQATAAGPAGLLLSGGRTPRVVLPMLLATDEIDRARGEAADSALLAPAVPEAPPHAHARLTPGPAALTACRSIVVVVSGPEKRAMLDPSMTPDTDAQTVPATSIARLPRTVILVPDC